MADSPSPGWTAPPDADVQGETPLIYVVRDEELGRQDVAALSCAYAVLCTTDLADATELLRAHQKHVVGVLVDLGFREGAVDGAELANLLRGRHQGPVPAGLTDLTGLPIPVFLVRDPRQSPPGYEVPTLERPIDLGALTLLLADALVAALSGTVAAPSPGSR